MLFPYLFSLVFCTIKGARPFCTLIILNLQFNTFTTHFELHTLTHYYYFQNLHSLLLSSLLLFSAPAYY